MKVFAVPKLGDRLQNGTELKRGVMLQRCELSCVAFSFELFCCCYCRLLVLLCVTSRIGLARRLSCAVSCALTVIPNRASQPASNKQHGAGSMGGDID